MLICLTCDMWSIPYHPWDWYIYLHDWLIRVDVGKYTIKWMVYDGMGIVSDLRENDNILTF